METIHKLKKPGAGILAACLLLVLLLALPCAWYAVYHDQMTVSAAGPASPGMAALSRPSGIIALAPPKPGQTRVVQIQHTGGQVITTINDGHMTITLRGIDPRPPSNPLDVLGQNLCDHYNAWECERGDPHQFPGVIQVPGANIITAHMTSQPKVPSPLAHAPGTRAPGSPLHPVAHRPARP